jgi:phage antirepressor YoqD-like protein
MTPFCPRVHMMTIQPMTAAGTTMSSLDISDLVEARHDSVKRTIERLAAAGTIVQPPMVDVSSLDDIGRPRLTSVYLIGKRDSYVIVAQLSPAFTARLVDRWQELEAAAPAAPAELSRLQVLELAMASERERLVLADQLAAAAPAIEFVDRYCDSTGLKGFRQVAKLLQAKENQFREFLLSEKILYRLGGEMVPFAPHIDAGRFAVKAGTADSGHAFNSAKFTPKGVAWVAGEFARWKLTQRAGAEVTHA